MSELSKLNAAEKALAEAKTPEEARTLEAFGQGAIAYARNAAWTDEQERFENIIKAWNFYVAARRKHTELIKPEIVHGDHGLQDRVDTNVRSVPVIADYGFTHKQWSRRTKELDIPKTDIDSYIDECIEKTMEPTIAGLLRSCTEIIMPTTGDEWWTPKRYIDSTRRVLGDIDLDPASCIGANRIVQAKKIYTEAENGLRYPWRGRIFMNPPYSQNKAFAEKLLSERQAGNIEQAILLVGAHAIETGWFAPMWDNILCFTGHRIKFNTPFGPQVAGNISGSVFVYLGDKQRLFSEEFNTHGFVVRRWPQ